MGKGTKHSSFLNYKNLFRLIFYCSLLIILTTCGGDVKVEESSTGSGGSSSDTGPLAISYSTQPQVGSSTTIKGTFKDASGNPVSSKTLSVMDVIYNETSSVTTDSNGTFEFTTKAITLPIATPYFITDGSTSYMIQIVPSSDTTAEELISDITDQLSQSTTSSKKSAKSKKGKTAKKKSSGSSTSSESIQVNYYSIGSYTNQASSYSFSELRDKNYLQNLSDADVFSINDNLQLEYYRTLTSGTSSGTMTNEDYEVIQTLENSDFRNRYFTAVENAKKKDVIGNALATGLYGSCVVVSAPAPGINAVCFSLAMDSAWNTYNAFINHMEDTGRYTHAEAENWRNNVDKAETGLALIGLATAYNSYSTGEVLKNYDEIIATVYGAYSDGKTISDYISQSSVSSTSQSTIDSNTWDYTLLESSKTTTLTDPTGSPISVWDTVPVLLPVMATIPSQMPTTYSISGTVSYNGSALNGVTIMITTSEGSLVGATFTDTNGQYSFKVVNTGGYIIYG